MPLLNSGFGESDIRDHVHDDQAHSKPVATALDLVQKKGLYFRCNFQINPSSPSHTCAALLQVKGFRPGNEVCEEAHNLLDPMRTSLLLLGKATLGTGFHVDRTQAENIAFPVATKPQVQHACMSITGSTDTDWDMHKLVNGLLVLHIVCFCNEHDTASL